MATAVHYRSGEQSCLRHEGQVILTAPSEKMGKLRQAGAGRDGKRNMDGRRWQALALYDKLVRQPRAEFTGWRLQVRLPCIAFHVTAFDAGRTSDTNVYIAKAAVLEATRICTADKFSPKGLFLVCPWIHELLDLGLPHGYRDVEADFESTSHLSTTPAESVFHETSPSRSYHNALQSPSSLAFSPVRRAYESAQVRCPS